jgi:hypothetical protein
MQSMGEQEEFEMGARLAFVFSRTHSGARSKPFQTARQANNSFPVISCKRKDCERRQEALDPSRHASASWRFPPSAREAANDYN